MCVAQHVSRELLADDALVVVKTVLQSTMQAQWRFFASLSEHISIDTVTLELMIYRLV
jgi:hypothetical protein